VLGQDVLRSANWWLDYRRRVLIADDGGALLPFETGERVAVRWEADRPTVDALLSDRTALRLVLDSGASAPILFHGVAILGQGEAGGTLLTTVAGAATARWVTLGPLRVGALVVRPPPAAMLEGERSRARREDGLLPTALFDAIYFDNRADAVVLNPRAGGPED
jgi:hypothetical protein